MNKGYPMNGKYKTENEYSVVQFFEDGSYEYVRRFVSAEEAVNAAKHYCTSVGVKMGLVKRVIITDGGDCCCFEWLHDKGIVYPPKESNGTNTDNPKG